MSFEKVFSGEQPYYLHLGDCLEFLKTVADNSVDAIVSDPPAGIGFMNKEWDKDKGGRDHWVAWMQEIAVECLRVLKPGGHALIWSLPRTSHWTAYAWENAGFEVRDNIVHIFGSGFPKSLDISKAIDKEVGAEREVVGYKKQGTQSMFDGGKPRPATLPAKQYSGFGTALKPAHEDWWLLRKPIEKGLTIAQNCLKWGTGGLDIDSCRVSTNGEKIERTGLLDDIRSGGFKKDSAKKRYDLGIVTRATPEQGRFPANVILDDSECVRAVFPETGKSQGGGMKDLKKGTLFQSTTNKNITNFSGFGDSGSAARFFYCAKASQSERNQGLDDIKNTHPTIKPISLCEYLIKLISKPGDTVLDPFTGSGTTGVACMNLNRRFIGCELNDDYFEITKNRIDQALNEPKQEELFND